MTVEGEYKWFLSRWVRQQFQDRKIDNYAWIVSWEITHKCNLRCQYCFVRFEDSHPDPTRAIQTVIDLHPRMLLISGGEPLLVPTLPTIIDRVYRACDQPHIVLTTNLSVHIRAVLPILPYLHTLHVSIDGLDGHNERQRGISSEIILKNLAEVIKFKREKGVDLPQILTATIVTEQNFRDIGRLVEVLYALDPSIIMTFGTVEPQEHPMSLMQNRNYYHEFHEIFWQLKKKYPVEIVGILGNRMTRDKALKEGPRGMIHDEGPRFVRCYRQFFRTVVLPDGQTLPCKPRRYLDYYEGYLDDLWQRGQYRRFIRTYLKMVRDILVKPYHPTCYFPCKCEEFLDDLIMAHNRAELPSQARFFSGRLERERDMVAEKFIRKHFNPHFSLDLFGGKENDNP